MRSPRPVHDFIGVGIGPFNLGLAALSAPVPELSGLFLEARESFAWHHGMMLDDATIQVPFLADLVTMADPTSPYSFLQYLKETGRLYPFYIRESFYPLRAEYDAYCRWVAGRVPGLHFGVRVERVEHDAVSGLYRVHAREVATGTTQVHLARRIVIGIGSTPWVPEAATGLGGPVWHSSDYLHHKAELQELGSITVVGSGQSAAEIYLDLLGDAERFGYRVDWVTRSPRFSPMEYTKLTLELTSPEYVRYHHALSEQRRDSLAREQRHLHHGISADLIDTIFDTLYRMGVRGRVPASLLSGVSLAHAEFDAERRRFELRLHHGEQDRTVTRTTDGLVLATGYRPSTPTFLDPVHERIRWDSAGRYDVALGYTVDHGGSEIFVQNGEEHTHSLVAPDLGMGAFRSSVIINAMCGREVYPVERNIAHQDFGVDELTSSPVEALTATAARR